MQRNPLHSPANSTGVVFKHDKIEGKAPMTKVVVADIVFSFNNQDLIFALRKRGSLIANQKFDAMRAQDIVVNNLFNDFDKLTVPVSAFITFEEEDGKLLALKTSS
jgi:hypothetical protein